MKIDITRDVPFTITRAEGERGDGLTLEGYAAVFGQPARIDSWEGMFDETFRRGAFKKTLRDRTPLMQYDHGRHPLVGSIPIGRFERISEDERGLHVVGRLSDNWLIEPVRDAISDGGVTGMSIRFEVTRDEWRDAQGKTVKPEELMELLWAPGERGPLQRTVIEARLLEAGPVAWPAYEGTSVGVRARDAAAALLSDEERTRALRQSLAAAVPDPAPGADVAPADVDPHELAVALLAAGVDPDTRSAAETSQTSETPEPGTPDEPAPAPSPAPPTVPTEAGHPDDDTEPDTRSAPPAEAPAATPPSNTDAPPAAGHPSPEHAERRRLAREAYVTLHGVGKKS